MSVHKDVSYYHVYVILKCKMYNDILKFQEGVSSSNKLGLKGFTFHLIHDKGLTESGKSEGIVLWYLTHRKFVTLK